MARGKEIGPLIKSMIIKQFEEGTSQAELGRALAMNRQTVNSIITRHQKVQEAKKRRTLIADVND